MTSGLRYENPYVVMHLKQFGLPDSTHCVLWIITTMNS